MRSFSRAATAVGLIGLGLAAVAGAFLGFSLGADASEPAVSQVRIVNPALFAGPPAHARRSEGGFTGFGAAMLPGQVIAGGEFVSAEPSEGGSGTLVFRDGGRETTVRYLEATRLFELVAGAELAVGDNVVVRIEDGDVVGLLRIAFEIAEADAGAGTDDTD